MQRTQLIDELKLLRKRHRNDKYATFETRWIDVLDAVIGELEESSWHTGTPTEEGDYLVAVSYYPLIQVEYQINRYLLEPYNDFIYQIEGEGRIVAWQKIEPYRG